MRKRELFEELYSKMQDSIFRICTYYADNEMDQHDLFQSIWENIWIGLEKFKGEAKIETYITKIAINSSITFSKMRSKHKQKHNSYILDEQKFQSLEEMGISEDEVELVYRSLNRLKPLEKSIILLQLEGHDNESIASIVGISDINVRVMVHRIRNKLKTMING
jgi:RNA polymerase sigma-70 factor (ECF subfamily)